MPIGESVVTSFRGRFRFLSNFYPAATKYGDIVFSSVEHAYQAAKTRSRSARLRIKSLPTPGMAKREGRRLVLRDGWDDVRLKVMYTCLSSKFHRNERLREMLLATGARELREGNDWGDRFWGVVNGQGENNLGQLLMWLRDELRTGQSCFWVQSQEWVKFELDEHHLEP